MTHEDDADSIASYDAGDALALDALIERHMDGVYRYLLRLLGDEERASDAAQETFYRMWKGFRTFDRSRNFKAWLFAVARNAAMDIVRVRSDVPMSAFDDDEGGNPILGTLEDAGDSPLEETMRKADAAMLAHAMEKLGAREREALHLRFAEEMTFAEMGEALGEPLDTVKSRVRRALISLGKLLVDDAPKPQVRP